MPATEDRLKIAIVEEYGYRDWIAYLTQEEYDELCRRWKTMKGLHCGVPVTLIIPQAKLVDFDDPDVWKDVNVHELASQPNTRRCHIHEHDDSYLEGCEYEIPEAQLDGSDPHFCRFEMDGVSYTYAELQPHRQAEQEYIAMEHARRDAAREATPPSTTPEEASL